MEVEAIEIGAKVSNNSYGGGGYSQSFYDIIAAARHAPHGSSAVGLHAFYYMIYLAIAVGCHALYDMVGAGPHALFCEFPVNSP